MKNEINENEPLLVASVSDSADVIKTVNSISGGKTSAYISKHYSADINVFSLVRIDDKDCLWMNGKDEKTRQLISDRIGKEFIGTAEMDDIIYTILDLEQFIGSEIKIISGKSFEEIILDRGNYLPNKMVRYCTSEMKFFPIFNYLKGLEVLPVEMRIGYRPNETDRAERMSLKAVNGFEQVETIIGRSKNDKRNKLGMVDYRVAKFPLIEENITKDIIYNYWENKPVRFAYRNNCVMCINRQPLMISHMTTKDIRKIEWANRIEQKTGNTFLSDVSMSTILKYSVQGDLFNDDDFSDCDSGNCEL
jgi:hypothetical protein